MFGILKKKKALNAICTGKCIPLEDVKDEVFSSKVMGDGIGIIPNENLVVSPCKGKVTMIMEESKHALSIMSADGIEILIHIGVDTVKLKGEGFKVLTAVDEKVNVNTPLISFDLDNLKENQIDSTIMMIITNEFKIKNKYVNTNVVAGESITIEY